MFLRHPLGAVTVAIALVEPVKRALSRCGTAQGLGLKLSQAVCGKAELPPATTSASGRAKRSHQLLLQQRAKGDLVIGRRVDPTIT